MLVYIGIDPGANGGIVALPKDGAVYLSQMPGSLEEICKEIFEVSDIFSQEEVVCCVEKVSGYAGVGHPGSAMFNFGENSGALKAACICQGWALNLIRPQEWQKGLGIESKRKWENDSDWKNRLRNEAEKRFPKIRPSLKTADALLICAYAMTRDISTLFVSPPKEKSE